MICSGETMFSIPLCLSVCLFVSVSVCLSVSVSLSVSLSLSLCLTLGRDCEILCQEGFNNTLHSLDLLNHRLTANRGRGYVLLQRSIRETCQEAKGVSSEEFQSHIAIISETLEAHVDITRRLLAEKPSPATPGINSTASSSSSLSFLANSKDYMDLTGHLVVSWMWLRQGVVAYEKLENNERNGQLTPSESKYYYGKMCALDYYCSHELVKARGLIALLRANPQLNNAFSAEWF
jgi:hypothetical protein